MTSPRATRGGGAAGGGAGRADLVDEEDLCSHVDAHAGDGAHSGVHACGGDTWHRGDIAAAGGDPPLSPGGHPDAPRPHAPIFPCPTPRVPTSPRRVPQAPAAARTPDPPHPGKVPGWGYPQPPAAPRLSPCASPPLVSTAIAMPAPAIRSRSSSAAAIAALPGTGVPSRPAPRWPRPLPLGHAHQVVPRPAEAPPPPPRRSGPCSARLCPRCAAPPGRDGQTDPRAMLTYSIFPYSNYISTAPSHPRGCHPAACHGAGSPRRSPVPPPLRHSHVRQRKGAGVVGEGNGRDLAGLPTSSSSSSSPPAPLNNRGSGAATSRPSTSRHAEAAAALRGPGLRGRGRR